MSRVVSKALTPWKVESTSRFADILTAKPHKDEDFRACDRPNVGSGAGPWITIGHIFFDISEIKAAATGVTPISISNATGYMKVDENSGRYWMQAHKVSGISTSESSDYASCASAIALGTSDDNSTASTSWTAKTFTFNGTATINANNNEGLSIYTKVRKDSGWASNNQVHLGTLRLNVSYTEYSITFSGVTDTATVANIPQNKGVSASAPDPSKVGYIFTGWRSSVDGKSYVTNNLPVATADVTYTAEYTAIPYYVNVTTVDQSGNTITAPSGQTGNTTYYVGDTITVAAPSGDYNYDNDTTYVFSHWSLHDANGNTLVGTNSNRSYTVGTINATTISQWFSAGTTITAKAHYQRVYDLVLSLSGVTAEDPSGVGNAGFDEVVITSGSQSYTFDRDDLLSANASDYTQRLTVASATVVFKLTSNSTYKFVRPSYENITVNGSQGSWDLSQQVTWYVTCGTSHPTLQISVLKKAFDIIINGDSNNIVPTYYWSGSSWARLNSRTGIARERKVLINTTDTDQGTYRTPYRVASRQSNTDGVTFTDGVCTIASLKQDVELTVTLEAVEFTVTDVVVQTETDGTTNTTEAPHEHIPRSSQYTFSYTDVEGYYTESAIVTNSNGDIVRSLTTNQETQYTAEVYDNLTFTVHRSGDANLFVYAEVAACPHGTVQLTPTSVLRSNFQGFLYSGVQMEAAYEVVSATYQWAADGVPQGNPVALSPNTLIQYSGTMPSGVDVRCLVTVTTRKNMLYYSHVVNNTNLTRQVQRAAEIYYTDLGQAPVAVNAVMIQTPDNPFPQLLYGNEDDFIIRRTVYGSTYAELNILTQTMTVTGNDAVPTERCAVFQDWWPYVRHVKWLILDVAGNTMPEHALDGFVYLEDVQTSLTTDVSRNAHIDGERLVIDSLSTDDAEDYIFTIENEGLVVSYGSD